MKNTISNKELFQLAKEGKLKGMKLLVIPSSPEQNSGKASLIIKEEK